MTVGQRLFIGGSLRGKRDGAEFFNSATFAAPMLSTAQTVVLRMCLRRFHCKRDRLRDLQQSGGVVLEVTSKINPHINECESCMLPLSAQQFVYSRMDAIK